MDQTARLRSLYDAFNARDLNGLLAAMTDDVDWPNAWEGGRLRGRDAVREYWIRQWAELEPRLELLAITERPDGAPRRQSPPSRSLGIWRAAG